MSENITISTKKEKENVIYNLNKKIVITQRTIIAITQPIMVNLDYNMRVLRYIHNTLENIKEAQNLLRTVLLNILSDVDKETINERIEKIMSKLNKAFMEFTKIGTALYELQKWETVDKDFVDKYTSILSNILDVMITLPKIKEP